MRRCGRPGSAVRVLFLTLYPEPAASPRYRVLQYLPYLREKGVNCTVMSALKPEEYESLSRRAREGRAFRYHAVELRRRVWQLLRSRAYDIVFVQKAIMSTYVKPMATLLQWRARRVVYDIDDAVNIAAPVRLSGIWRGMEDAGQINKVMARASLVIAGNGWLKSVAEAAGARAELLPTVVDTARFVPAEDSPETYRVGWMGGPSTCENLKPIAEILSDIEDAEVCLVGADPEQVTIQGAKYRIWSLESEVREVQAFSVGLMPLPKDEWSRGKCALKAIQYMACGVPCVATPYGAVCDVIEHDVNGLFADSPSEWKDALERLRNPGLRARLGAAARETVETRYSLATAAPRMHELLESVVS